LIVEEQPWLEVRQLKELPAWPRFADDGVARVVLDLDGDMLACDIELITDRVPLGIRWWLRCPGCGRRRLHLYVVNGEITCRCCAGLLYYQQSLPDSRWRRDVGIPVLKAVAAVRRRQSVRASKLGNLGPLRP
jgi:hypothetical protein